MAHTQKKKLRHTVVEFCVLLSRDHIALDITLYSPAVTICTASLTLKILRSAHTVYLCVLYGSENKLRLFPYTALTDWFGL